MALVLLLHYFFYFSFKSVGSCWVVSGYTTIFCVLFMFERLICLAKRVVFLFRLIGLQVITGHNRVDPPTHFATLSIDIVLQVS
jgi:hypothetical protein